MAPLWIFAPHKPLRRVGVKANPARAVRAGHAAAMSDLDRLASPYATILCDIWGVIHDGGRLLPGAAERLLAWKAEGKTIILVTNAPRPASSVQAGLDALGLSRAAYNAITSSGEAGIAALVDPPRGVGFLGTDEDRADLIAHGVTIVDVFDELACTGLDGMRERRRTMPLCCPNGPSATSYSAASTPTAKLIDFGRREYCAGALADVSEAMGGQVAWYGKPRVPKLVRRRCGCAGNPPRSAVLAIGDDPVTDMLGAARAGIDAVYIATACTMAHPCRRNSRRDTASATGSPSGRSPDLGRVAG